MKALLALALCLAACKEKRRPPPPPPEPPADAAVFRGPVSPPFRIELPGAIPQAVAATPDGGAIVGLVITAPVAIAGTTFTPERGPDALIVRIAGDGQPRAAVSVGLEGIASVEIADVALAPDGTVRVGLVTSSAVPGARGEPTEGPGAGGRMYTLASVDLARGVTDLVEVGTTAEAADTTLAIGLDGGAVVERSGMLTHLTASGARAWERTTGLEVYALHAALVDLVVLACEPAWCGAITIDGAGREIARCGVDHAATPVAAVQACPEAARDLGAQVDRVLAARRNFDPRPGLPTEIAILADGGVLLVGPCDADRKAGCLLRANPTW